LTKIIAITNQKGGVGKTTTTINVAASIAVAERKTLIIDMDPQANATSGLGVDHNTIEKSIYEVLLKDTSINDTILSTEIAYLDLIPASIRLVGAEIELVSVLEREKVLREAIKGLKKKYDYIFIDCPPSLGLLTINDVRKFFEKKVFDTVIQRNVRLSEAPSFGKPAILYDAICSGTESYMRLAEEIINHEK